jgi:hypothetical protein
MKGSLSQKKESEDKIVFVTSVTSDNIITYLMGFCNGRRTDVNPQPTAFLEMVLLRL